MDFKKDYYAYLGVLPSATQEDIKRAYRRIARESHSDVNPSKEAKINFLRASEAYELLSNEENRNRYDTGRMMGMATQISSNSEVDALIKAGSYVDGVRLCYRTFETTQASREAFAVVEHLENKGDIKGLSAIATLRGETYEYVSDAAYSRATKLLGAWGDKLYQEKKYSEMVLFAFNNPRFSFETRTTLAKKGIEGLVATENWAELEKLAQSNCRADAASRQIKEQIRRYTTMFIPKGIKDLGNLKIFSILDQFAGKNNINPLKENILAMNLITKQKNDRLFL